MSDTAKDWRMVADLLAANVDRFEGEDIADVIDICRTEANRLDREAARDAEVEELVRAMRAVDEGRHGGTYAELARAVIAHLADRLAPAGGMVLTADEVADLRNVLAHSDRTSILRARFAPAEKPAPRSWPSLDQVPIVKIVANEHGAQAMHHFMDGWRWRLTGGVIRAEDRVGTWTEQVSA